MAKLSSKVIKWSSREVCPECGGDWIEGTYAEGCADCGAGVRYGYAY